MLVWKFKLVDGKNTWQAKRIALICEIVEESQSNYSAKCTKNFGMGYFSQSFTKLEDAKSWCESFFQ
jgi:hypothetical protein